jgi:hypothetical protein
MYPSIAHPGKQWIIAALITISHIVAGLSGGCSTLTQGGASLEFVGHLISGFHDLSLERLDPTYPHCF